jgi:type I restriction enzyme S subunit
MFLLSPLGRDAIEKQAASTSGLHTLSVSKVQRLPVPLCSLPEQQEIVRLLDEQFEAIERNERELAAALQRSEALRQAILKKAFSGRLVPQDPTDEPASTLLARLRAERATPFPAKKRKSSVST